MVVEDCTEEVGQRAEVVVTKVEVVKVVVKVVVKKVA